MAQLAKAKKVESISVLSGRLVTRIILDNDQSHRTIQKPLQVRQKQNTKEFSKRLSVVKYFSQGFKTFLKNHLSSKFFSYVANYSRLYLTPC